MSLVKEQNRQGPAPPLGQNREQSQVERDAGSTQAAGGLKPVQSEQKKLEQTLAQLQGLAYQLRWQRGQDLQTSLKGAAAALQDGRQVDTLADLLQRLEQGLQDAQASPSLRQIVKELEDQTRQQLEGADFQVVRAMQQAIAALAQAQTALCLSQSCRQFRQLVQECKKILDRDGVEGKAGN